jgi:TPR repeat protein
MTLDGSSMKKIMFALALVLVSSVSFAEDEQQTYPSLFIEWCETGNAAACYFAGLSYLGNQAPDKSYIFFTKACSLDNADGCEAYAQLKKM